MRRGPRRRKPDLQGFWDFRTLTPLERPATVWGTSLSSQRRKRVRSGAERGPAIARRGIGRGAQRRAKQAAGRGRSAAADFWLDFGDSVVKDRRTSLLIDPPDGRLPARQGGVRQRAEQALSRRICRRSTRSACSAPAPARTTPDRGLAERLVGFNSGPPMLPSGNNHMQLVQTSDYVAIS